MYSYIDMSLKLLLVCFEGLARLSRRVWRRFVRGSREILLVPSLHRASTDALIKESQLALYILESSCIGDIIILFGF